MVHGQYDTINRRIDPNRTMRYGVPLIRSSIFSASGYLILRYTAKELFNICMVYRESDCRFYSMSMPAGYQSEMPEVSGPD